MYDIIKLALFFLTTNKNETFYTTRLLSAGKKITMIIDFQ
jgi:hypothetical protein